MQAHADQKSRVLVVDDDIQSLETLCDQLRERGYDVRPVTAAEEGIRVARHSPPDIILLDIMMEGMDGYEACEILQADPDLAEIPVIFISAKGEAFDKVRAFGVGAVDYISKPFHDDEVTARVQTHVDLRRQRRELQESYERLRELDELKDNLTAMIVHDLGSPLSSVISSLHMVVDREFDEDTTDELTRIALSSSQRLLEMVNTLLDITKMESGELEPEIDDVEIAAVADAAHGQVRGLADECGHHVRLDIPRDLPPIRADGDLLLRTLVNLLANALKFTQSAGEVWVTARSTSEVTTVSVTDNGPGIPPEDLARIFEKFGQAQVRQEGRKHSTGLGLTFCKMVVEAHGGHMTVDSEVGKGSTFEFTIPREPVPPEHH